MKLHNTAAAIDTAIKSIALRGKRLDHDIHVTGTSCIQHIELHGDVTLLNRLVLALPKGARKTAFVEWALAFGKVQVLDKGNAKDADAIARGDIFKFDKTKTTKLEDAIAKAWYEFKPEGDILDHFDVNAVVAQLMRKYSKAQKDGLKIEGIEDAKAQLRALMQSLETQGETL